MRIQKTEKHQIELSKEAGSTVYVQSWGKMVDLDFTDTDKDGVRHELEIKMSVDQARNVVEELVKDLAAYDKRLAEEAAEAAEAADAAESSDK